MNSLPDRIFVMLKLYLPVFLKPKTLISPLAVFTAMTTSYMAVDRRNGGVSTGSARLNLLGVIVS